MNAASFLPFVTALLAPGFLQAGNVAWTNAAGESDRNWFTAQNWSAGEVPGPSDNVLLEGQSSEAKPIVYQGESAINRLQMAEHEGSESWLTITGGSLGAGVGLEQAQVGVRGLGSIRQTGGDVVVPGLVIGRLANGHGLWEISAGTLEVVGQNETLYIGYGENIAAKPATGRLTVQGKAVVRVARGIQLGNSSGCTGTIQILGPMARLEVGKNMRTASAEIEVGVEGQGTILIKGGWLDVAALSGGEGINLKVGNRDKGTGVVQGFGTINTFINKTRPNLELGNAWVVADGFGADNTLNLSSYGNVIGARENTGNFGWYAQNKGRLVLPSLKVEAGARELNWGESKDDAEIDLVNSMRLTFDKTNTGGRLSVVLLAPDHKDAPPGLPPGTVGLWKVVYPAPSAGLSALQVRYFLNGVGEERLRFVRYNAGTKQWEPCATTLDPSNRRARTEGNLADGFYALLR